MEESTNEGGARPEMISTGVRVVMRNYFSTQFLRAARKAASEAEKIEEAHTGGSVFDMEHRAHVLNAVVTSATFLEAMINELFQDAHDGHNLEGDGYVAPLPARAIQLMAGWWAESREGFEGVLEKYQLLLLFADAEKLDPAAEPYQSAALLVRLRNSIIHYRSESVAADEEHRFTKALRGKFPDNRLMSGSGNPWWPSHALGAGCAWWSFESAKALADHATDKLGISPNYRRHEARSTGD